MQEKQLTMLGVQVGQLEHAAVPGLSPFQGYLRKTQHPPCAVFASCVAGSAVFACSDGNLV